MAAPQLSLLDRLARWGVPCCTAGERGRRPGGTGMRSRLPGRQHPLPRVWRIGSKDAGASVEATPGRRSLDRSPYHGRPIRPLARDVGEAVCTQGYLPDRNYPGIGGACFAAGKAWPCLDPFESLVCRSVLSNGVAPQVRGGNVCGGVVSAMLDRNNVIDRCGVGACSMRNVTGDTASAYVADPPVPLEDGEYVEQHHLAPEGSGAHPACADVPKLLQPPMRRPTLRRRAVPAVSAREI